ncbi:MAG: 2-phosphosulfolactate phosphatase [Gemmatimonadales bacterium]|jgi:2-phosphosulfolactate phosphatase
MRVDVLTSPGELEGEDLSGSLVVVVDVVRATTTLLAGLEAGARRAHAVESVEDALDLRRSIGEDDVVLCGERGGRRIDGFDLGNSPLEFEPAAVAGKILVCTTSNGTRMVSRCETADELWLGCFRNRAALVEGAAEVLHGGPEGQYPSRLLIACAGKQGRLGLDDHFCAGLIVEGLAESVPEARLSDGARSARATAGEIGLPSAAFLATTAAGGALVEIGLEADLEYCAELDVSRSIPRWEAAGFSLSERS